MSKHTKGTWVYDTDSSSVGRYHGVETEDGYMICECHEGGDDAEKEANARLIAAAPDMLAALESCLNFIANTEGELGETLPSGNRARAAIAKAKGQTQ